MTTETNIAAYVERAGAFRCGGCGAYGSTRVIDSRPSKSLVYNAINRRRLCKRCGHRFTTYELALPDVTRLLNTVEAALEAADMIGELGREFRETFIAADDEVAS